MGKSNWISTLIGVTAAAYVFIAATPAKNETLFDSWMTPEQIQKTGLLKLTYQEQKELLKWIRQNCVNTKDERKPVSKDTYPYVTETLSGGEILALSNGAKYRIAPEDRYLSSVWISPIPVEITASGDPDYPALITSRYSRSSVKGVLLPK